MTMDLAKPGTMPAEMATAVEAALVTGDLSKLTTEQRIAYYRATCDSLGLNYLTKPFDYLTLNGKLVLYANRGTTDQLRSNKGVSCTIVSRERMDDVYIVAARATLADGRYDESTGVVTVGNLKGDALANALMKAETKAKRRATLSICGLGWMDETEVETVRTAVRPVFQVEVENGEMVERVQGEVVPPARTQTRQPAQQGAPDDDMAVQRQIRERLMDGWAAVWNRAQQLGIETPNSDVSQLTNVQLSAAGADLKAKVEAELDRREAESKSPAAVAR